MLHPAETEFDRDSAAKWYAQRHFDTDIGVERVFYLPTNAPPREIRLLEINNLIAEMIPPEPIDFGVDIEGLDRHTLYVLDLTPDQWKSLQNGKLSLPIGWTLDGMIEFGRRSNES